LPVDNRRPETGTSVKYAIDNYEKLVQKNGWVLPPHVETYLSGREIYDRSKEGDDIWVGRKGGKSTFIKDIMLKIWNKRKYCVSWSKPSNGLKGQWISGMEFSELVDNHYS
jgi:hypothetical protein